MSTVVYQEVANNFTSGSQSINGRDIMSAVFGPGDPSIAPTRAGEVFFQLIEGSGGPNANMWVSVRDTLSKLTWERVNYADLPEHVAITDKKNVFTELDQKLGDHNIMSFVKVEGTPETYGKAPDFDGQLLMGFKNTGTPGQDAADIWVGKGTKWLPLHFDYSDFANLNNPNNFKDLNQTIKNRQILSFVNGGDKTPEQSLIRPEYDGQHYIAFKDIGGKPDFSMWIANGNTWLPAINEKIDVSKLAKLDMANVFENPNQMLGVAEKGRLITGTRIKNGGGAPISDASWVAEVEGEETIYFNTTVTPAEVSIWKAISTTGTQASDWKMIWSSKTDWSNFARLDYSNHFQAPQKYGPTNEGLWVCGARYGFYDPNAASSPDFVPWCAGETYVREYSHESAVHHQVYMAMHTGDKDSWECIYDSADSPHSMESRITHLEAYDEVVIEKFKEIDSDLDDMAGVIGNLEKDFEVDREKLNNLDLYVNGESEHSLSSRVHANEQSLDEHHRMITEPVMWQPGRVVDYLGQLAWNDNKRMFMGVQKGHVDWKQLVMTDPNSAVAMSYDELHESHENHAVSIESLQGEVVTLSDANEALQVRIDELEAEKVTMESRLTSVEAALAGISIWSLDM